MNDEIPAHKFHDALSAANLEYSGLSWGGFNLFGDSKSIAEARRLQHGAGTVPVLQQLIAEARQSANETEDRRRHLEDVSCRQQNEIKSLNTRITNLWYALDRVKHGAEYCDELGGIINAALNIQQRASEGKTST